MRSQKSRRTRTERGETNNSALKRGARQIETEDLENPEDREWDELRDRRSRKECTCDLLSPYGHVTCTFCNEEIG